MIGRWLAGFRGQFRNATVRDRQHAEQRHRIVVRLHAIRTELASCSSCEMRYGREELTDLVAAMPSESNSIPGIKTSSARFADSNLAAFLLVPKPLPSTTKSACTPWMNVDYRRLPSSTTPFFSASCFCFSCKRKSFSLIVPPAWRSRLCETDLIFAVHPYGSDAFLQRRSSSSTPAIDTLQ